MIAPRPAPALAFAVGTLGIALFSGMDAVMKGLVLAIGVYSTMLWRSFASVAMAGAGYAYGWQRWPERRVLRIHVERGVLTSFMGLLFFWGIGHVPLAQAIALAFIAPLIALYLAAVLLAMPRLPVVVAAAVVHAELATVRPFVRGNAVVARALDRAVVQAGGLDPTGVAVTEAGHGGEAIARIRAPVGLDIGAVTAPEIALSIIAQVVAARRGRPL